MFEMKIELLIS